MEKGGTDKANNKGNEGAEKELLTKADKKQMLDQFNGQLEELKKLITMTQKEISGTLNVFQVPPFLTPHLDTLPIEI